MHPGALPDGRANAPETSNTLLPHLIRSTTCRGNGVWGIVLTSVHRFNPGEP